MQNAFRGVGIRCIQRIPLRLRSNSCFLGAKSEISYPLRNIPPEPISRFLRFCIESPKSVFDPDAIATPVTNRRTCNKVSFNGTGGCAFGYHSETNPLSSDLSGRRAIWNAHYFNQHFFTSLLRITRNPPLKTFCKEP